METNPYEYDRAIPWIPQQNQFLGERDAFAPASRQRPGGLQAPVASLINKEGTFLDPATLRRVPSAGPAFPEYKTPAGLLVREDGTWETVEPWPGTQQL